MNEQRRDRDESALAVNALLAVTPLLVGVTSRAVNALGDGVSLSQFRLLRVLADLGSAPSGAAADRLGTAASSVTRLADRLEDSGHLIRRRERPNRSMVRLELTDTGRAVVEEVLSAQRRELHAIVERLPTSTVGHIDPVLHAVLAAASTVVDPDPAELHVP